MDEVNRVWSEERTMWWLDSTHKTIKVMGAFRIPAIVLYMIALAFMWYLAIKAQPDLTYWGSMQIMLAQTWPYLAGLLLLVGMWLRLDWIFVWSCKLRRNKIHKGCAVQCKIQEVYNDARRVSLRWPKAMPTRW